MARRRTSGDTFERKLERWAKSFTSMDASTPRSLTSSRDVRSVEKFIRAEIEKETHLVDTIGKEHKSLPPSPPTSPSVSDSSIDVELRKLARNKTKNTDKRRDDEQKSCRKQKKSSPSFSGLFNLLSTPASSKADSVIIKAQKVRKEKRSEAELPVHQTGTKNYEEALYYRTYWLVNKSSKYDKKVSSYIVKLVKNVKLQMKAHFFDKKDPISIIRLSHTFNLPCDTNRINEGAAMCVLSRYVY